MRGGRLTNFVIRPFLCSHAPQTLSADRESPCTATKSREKLFVKQKFWTGGDDQFSSLKR